MLKIRKLIKNDSGAVNLGLLVGAVMLIGFVYIMGITTYTPNCPTGQTWDGVNCIPTSPIITPVPTVLSTPRQTVMPTPVPTVILTPVPTPPPIVTPINLIKNPTFDTNVYNWNLNTNGSSIFKSVNGKGVISVFAKGTNTQIYQSNIALKANTKYRLTFDASSNTGRDMQVRIIKHISPYTQYTSFFPNLNPTTSTFTNEFITSSSESNARLLFYVGYLAINGDTYYIDNVKLIEVPR